MASSISIVETRTWVLNLIKDLDSELGFEQKIPLLRNLVGESRFWSDFSHSKKSDFFFSEPKFNFPLQELSQNRISSSQISTFHSKKSDFSSSLLQEFEKSSQNRIFFLLRTQVSIFHSKKPDFFFSEPKIKIGFFLLKFRLFTPRNLIFPAFYSKNSKSEVKIGFFFFLEPKFRFFTSRNLIFSFRNPKSKSYFIFSNFDFTLQEIWF